MSRNLKGRGSRESFRELMRLMAERMEMTPQEAERIHSFLNSIVFPDELDQAIEDAGIEAIAAAAAAAAVTAHVTALH